MTTGTILITGANRGIGLELTRQFAGDGWQVIVSCRSPADAGDLRALAERNPAIETHALDVTDYEQMAALGRRRQGRGRRLVRSSHGEVYDSAKIKVEATE